MAKFYRRKSERTQAFGKDKMATKLEAASTITQQPQERHYFSHADSLLLRNYYLEGLSDGLAKCRNK